MANVFIEPHPKGRSEGSPIDDYAVETRGSEVLKEFKTQSAGITWAKENGHTLMLLGSAIPTRAIQTIGGRYRPDDRQARRV